MKSFSSFITESLTLQYHDELNPLFWENDKLKPEIRKHLLYVAKFWQEFAKIPLDIIEDIILVGGNANYNYTENSDLDIHFVIHKDKLKASKDIIDEYLKDKKELWSKIHHVQVKGHDVELYAQDINDPYQKDQGVYSLQNDEWLVHPHHVRVDYDNPHLLHKVDDLKNKIDSLISSGADEFAFQRLKDKIKNMRVSGLKKSGEFSYENLVFKELRNSGYLDRMNDYMNQSKDTSLSLNEYKLTFRKPNSMAKKIAAAGLGLAAATGTFLAAKQIGTSIGSHIKSTVTPSVQYQTAQTPTVHPRNQNPAGQMRTQTTITPDSPAVTQHSEHEVPYDLVKKHLGHDQGTWDVYRSTLGEIESSGRYNIAGGSGNHYDGRYQLGAPAKTDAARILKVPDPGHTPDARAAYRADPKKQEQFLAGITIANHGYLMNGSKVYRGLSKDKQLEALAHAHNQGWLNTNKWLETGIDASRDGNNTSGTKHSNAVRDNLKAHREANK